MRKPLVSIVIPCYNATSLLKHCLKTVLQTRYPNFEIIIIDDYSSDGTYEILLEEYNKKSNIKILRNEKNFGPSKTRNSGIKAAKGKYIAFVETDMEVDPDWLLPLVEALEKDKSLGAVQSKVLDINKRNVIHSTGVLYDPHTFWVWNFACGLPSTAVNSIEDIGFGSVGSVVRKDVLEKVGGFDEKIVHNIDDTEMSWRIWLLGYRAINVSDSITYHWTAKPSEVRAEVTATLKSEVHFHKTPRIFLKNYQIQSLIKYLPWLYFAYFLRIFKNLFEGNINPLKGFLISILWNIVNLKDTINERRKIQSMRKRSDQEIFEIIGIKGSFFQVYFGKLQINLDRIKRVFG